MAAPPVSSAWSPLRHATFRALWLATLASNLGTWMQSVGAAWLMTSLTSSPVLIATVQAASTLPVFLLGFVAGAMADLVDRRKLLLVTQAWMCIAAFALSAAEFFHAVSPLVLLAFTFTIGLGAAITGPAWQAAVSELVPRNEIVVAVSLNSAGFNLARAVGPAVAGLILARADPGVIFLLNALSFVGVLFVLYRWQPAAHVSVLPAERLAGALRAGSRYLLYAPSLQRVLGRTFLFAFPASALWGLLPLVVKNVSGGGPLTYGFLLGGLGAGALIGAWLLPRFNQMMDLENLVTTSTLAFATATFGAAITHQLPALISFMFIGGIGWLTLLASLNATTRMVAPSWIEARALALYLMAFQGSLALGSLAFGVLASKLGPGNALLGASGTLILTIAARLFYKLQSVQGLDLSSAKSWPEPNVAFEVSPQSGPILVIAEYRVSSDRAEAFLEAMHSLRTARLRTGAFHWALFVDATDPIRHIEEFMTESWVEHLRQHERFTVDDSEVQQIVLSSLDEPPRISHYLAAVYKPESIARYAVISQEQI